MRERDLETDMIQEKRLCDGSVYVEKSMETGSLKDKTKANARARAKVKAKANANAKWRWTGVS